MLRVFNRLLSLGARILRKIRYIWYKIRCFFFKKIQPHQRLYIAIELVFWSIRRPKSLVKSILDKEYLPHNSLIILCLLKYGKINISFSQNPKVSIVIPVHNHFDYTYQCLKSIENHTKDVDYEIIIADDASTDETVNILPKIDNLNIVRNKKSLGFLRNCNNATKKAHGKYLLFLNNDTEVTNGWLSSLVDLMEQDSSIGLVGSKFIFPDGTLQEAGGIITKEGKACKYGGYDNPLDPKYNYIRDVDYISGASILISKKLWDEIGGFDERYVPAYCEDSDLAFAVRKKGCRVVYQPKSVVIHYEGVSNGTNAKIKSSVKHYQVENSIKLQKKWAKEFKELPSYKLNPLDFAYRDRLNGKKVVLVIDHYVPEFDKDAGSKTTYQYLKLFIKKGFLVKFLPDNFNRSSYTDALEQMGIEVLYGQWYAENWQKWIKANAHNIDVVYMNRPHISIKYIDFLKKNTNAKLIYYGHDLHFLREQREYELTGDESHKITSENIKKTEFEIMKKVDMAYYPSKVEEKLIKSIDKKINVKKINAYFYDDVSDEKYDFSKRSGIMFVGGFTHQPNVDAVLWFVNNVYSIVKQTKDIPFFVAGSNPPESIKELEKISGIHVKGYVSDEELSELYTNTKLVVVPLRYGAGIKGKVIEAMSKGAVIVTTSVGAEGIDKLNSLVPVVDEPEDFAKALLELYNQNKKLSEISLKEREYIKDNFGSEAAWKIIKNDFLNRKK